MRSGNILEWPFIIGDIVKKEPCFHRGMKGVRVQGRLWTIGPLFPMRQNDLNIIKRFHIEAADITHQAFPTRSPQELENFGDSLFISCINGKPTRYGIALRSEEQTSELQSLMRLS